MSNKQNNSKLTVGTAIASFRIPSRVNADTVDVPKNRCRDTTVVETPKAPVLLKNHQT